MSTTALASKVILIFLMAWLVASRRPSLSPKSQLQWSGKADVTRTACDPVAIQEQKKYTKIQK